MLKKKKSISILLILALVFTMVFASATVADAAVYNGSYWLKVNEQRNVITAYKKIDGKWKPVRAMLCSTGVGGATPRGTFYTQGKWNWGPLMNDVYGQYCTHITSDILFHSVYYLKAYDKKSQPTAQFNNLGSTASHGCIRLSVMDSKWIYDNCSVGTKVTIYRSSTSGPLGKPAGIKVSQSRYQYWDPTDPDPKNPYYLLKKPVITVSSKKNLNVQYGSSYNLTSYVSAKDPNTFMNLRSLLKVSQVRKYSSDKNAYVPAEFSTKKLGTYKVTYKVSDRYSGTSYKTIKIRVTDTLKAPVISGAKNRTVTWGDCDAVGDVTAKQASCDRTKSMQVYIKAPGAAKYKIHTYQEAKKYCFAQEGTYTVKYRAANKNNSAKVSRKIVTITSKKASINKNPVLTVPSKRTVELGAQNAFYGIKASHNGKDVTSRVKVAVQAPNETGYTELTQQAAKTYVFSKAGEYTLRYSVKNQYTPYQTITKFVTVTVFDPNPVIPEDPELPEIPEV